MIQEDTTTNTFPNNNKHNNTKSIEVEKVALPKNCIKDQETPPLAYFFPHILTQQECRSILDHANVRLYNLGIPTFLYIYIYLRYAYTIFIFVEY